VRIVSVTFYLAIFAGCASMQNTTSTTTVASAAPVAVDSQRVESARADVASAEGLEQSARAASPSPADARWSREGRIHRAERATGDARVTLAEAQCPNDASLPALRDRYRAASREFGAAVDRSAAVQEDFERMVNAPGYNAADEDEDETRADNAIAEVARARVAWRSALDAVTARCAAR
jgi:hypothetical protein